MPSYRHLHHVARGGQTTRGQHRSGYRPDVAAYLSSALHFTAGQDDATCPWIECAGDSPHDAGSHRERQAAFLERRRRLLPPTTPRAAMPPSRRGSIPGLTAVLGAP